MIPFRLKVKPKDYQCKAAEFSVNNPNNMQSIITGGGKTLISLMEGMLYFSKGLIDKEIFIVTKKSKLSYQVDMKKLTTIDIDKQVQVIYSMEDLAELYSNPDKVIGVAQYDYLTKIPIEDWKTFFRKYRTLVQMDEIHKLKTPMLEIFISKTTNAIGEKPVKSLTKLSQFIWGVREDITYVTGYTGSPLAKSIDDIFWVYSILRPCVLGNSLLEFYNEYIDYYAYLVPIKKGSQLKRTVVKKNSFKNQDKLKAIIDSMTFSYYPPKNVHFIPVYYDPMDSIKDYRKAVKGILDTYKERNVDEFGEKEEKTFSARMLDAQYVLNNSDNKKQALEDTIFKTISEGVLVFGSYYNSVEVIQDIMNENLIPCREISGRTSDKECQENMDWFNSDPEKHAVILTEAGAQSINLQSVNSMIFYDLPFTAGKFLQAIGRFIRLGSPYDEFFVYVIISKNTLDNYKWEYLGSNKQTVGFLTGNYSLFETELKTPNSVILDNMRKEYLWEKA